MHQIKVLQLYYIYYTLAGPGGEFHVHSYIIIADAQKQSENDAYDD